MSRGGNSKIRIIAIPGRTDFDESRKPCRRPQGRAIRPDRPLALEVWPVVRGSVSAIQTSALPLSRPQPARPDRILFPRDRLPADAVVEQNSTLARSAGAPADELSPDQVDKAEADARGSRPSVERIARG